MSVSDTHCNEIAMLHASRSLPASSECLIGAKPCAAACRLNRSAAALLQAPGSSSVAAFIASPGSQ
jgi:hypothetical protein